LDEVQRLLEAAGIPSPVVDSDDASLQLLEPPEGTGQAPRRAGEDAPFSERRRVWAASKQPAPSSATEGLPLWIRSGSLTDTTVPRLLNAYYQARADGELRLRQGQTAKMILFDGGKPVFATSNLVHERFGQFCARMGLLDGAQLIEVGRLVREKKIRTAEAMVLLGYLRPYVKRALLEEQIREIIWPTFLWREGQYQWTKPADPRPELVDLSLFPGDLILDGVKRTETLETLRAKLPRARRFFPASEGPYALYELKLSDPQARLVAHVDGTKTVGDLLELTRLGELEVLATLWGLLLTGQLEERHEGRSKTRVSFGV
jgi:hypothetical protein